MNTASRTALMFVGICVAASAQKNWTDKDEYDLYDAISRESDQNHRLALLNAWEAQYPRTEFQAERLTLVADSYQRTGRWFEAFEAARRLHDLDPNHMQGLLLLVMIGPNLPRPTDSDIETVTAAASKLLLPRPNQKIVEVSGKPGNPVVDRTAPSVDPPASDLSPDAETQRVDALVRNMRRNYRPPPDPIVDQLVGQRALAQKALDWVKNRKP